MNEIASLSLIRFSCIYLLLLLVLFVMKKCHIQQTKLLFIASCRMSLQLMIAGFILTAIFKNPSPFFTIGYLVAMILFAIYMVLSKNPKLNRRFQWIIALSLSTSGLGILAFFIVIVVDKSLLDPQYAIPISGMIIGNAVNGVCLALRTFEQSFNTQRVRIETLLNLGVAPAKIIAPMMNQAIETALIPIMNSMISMGIISLPGMMTGQILSGTLPTTAIFYQIAIIISLAAVTSLSSFCALFFGCRTLYNERCQMYDFNPITISKE